MNPRPEPRLDECGHPAAGRKESHRPGRVELGTEHFGEAADPLVPLVGAPAMLSRPDPLCRALARGGRHVVRYDLRDSGRSTTVDPSGPAYTLRDLAAAALAL